MPVSHCRGQLTEAGGRVRREATGVMLDLVCAATKTTEGAPPFGDGDKDTPQFLAAATVCFTVRAR
jgi:hypothetical protein